MGDDKPVLGYSPPGHPTPYSKAALASLFLGVVSVSSFGLAALISKYVHAPLVVMALAIGLPVCTVAFGIATFSWLDYPPQRRGHGLVWAGISLAILAILINCFGLAAIERSRD